MTQKAPVLAIDGPSGSGKGTISTTVAKQLQWHYLDSGAIYRVLGYLAASEGVEFDDVAGLVNLAKNLDLEFQFDGILLNGQPIGDEIRTEDAGKRASMVSPIPQVRQTLLEWQRSRAKLPGLVADGRDMGTVVFADSKCKIFLTANPQARAERRFKQLRDKGFDVTIPQLFKEISERDARDTARKASPLKPAENVIVLDTTEMSIEAVIAAVMRAVSDRLLI